jgi:NDP-sugar pyrophosphorylase family protein
MYALILAGGKGERLRPLTDTVPKPMIALCGRPILWHQVCWLREAGVTDVVFLVGHLADAVRDYFGDGSDYGIRAHYLREDEPLGRGGALRQGLASLPRDDRPVIATNGDVVTDASLAELIADYHSRRGRDPTHCATILTVPMTSPYGIVDTGANGVVKQFREKAVLPYEINGGVYVLHPGILDLLPETGDHEAATFPALAAEGRMSAVSTATFWRSVDSPKDLREAEEHLFASIAGPVEATR